MLDDATPTAEAYHGRKRLTITRGAGWRARPAMDPIALPPPAGPSKIHVGRSSFGGRGMVARCEKPGFSAQLICQPGSSRAHLQHLGDPLVSTLAADSENAQ